MDRLLAFLSNVPKSAKNIALSLAILLSLGSIHYVTYAYSFPSHLRVLLDATFKVDFVANFALVATFSVVFARYFPQTILAFGAFAASSVIGFVYYRRGYRRVASILGLFEKARWDDKEEKKRFQKRLASFGRNDARMDNFVREVIQRRLPVLWYEENKWHLMVPLALFLCLLFYVGLLYSMWLVFFFIVVSSAYETYSGFNDAIKFRLKGFHFSGDDPDHVPEATIFSSERLFLTATTCAIVFAVAGPLRLYNQIEDQNASILRGNSRVEASIIGSNGHGLLIYNDGFGFIPYSVIYEIR
jgi:hypothetical protein